MVGGSGTTLHCLPLNEWKVFIARRKSGFITPAYALAPHLLTATFEISEPRITRSNHRHSSLPEKEKFKKQYCHRHPKLEIRKKLTRYLMYKTNHTYAFIYSCKFIDFSNLLSFKRFS